VVIAFPLWLGMMPALAKAFLEQVSRGGFLLAEPDQKGQWPKRLMKGRSARVIVTMGMPEAVFQLLLDGGELKAVERGFLGMVGFGPVHHTVIGGVDASAQKRAHWLEQVRALGEKAL
jgi:putative NADPH-quinone reductase